MVRARRYRKQKDRQYGEGLKLRLPHVSLSSEGKYSDTASHPGQLPALQDLNFKDFNHSVLFCFVFQFLKVLIIIRQVLGSRRGEHLAREIYKNCEMIWSCTVSSNTDKSQNQIILKQTNFQDDAFVWPTKDIINMQMDLGSTKLSQP